MKRTIFVFLLCCLFIGVSVLAYAADKGLAGSDKKFMMEAASGGMMEVQLGQTVQQKAQSAEVKEFATRMVNDHGKANDELKTIAQQKGVTLPEKLEAKHKKTVDKISKLSGADLDKTYMKDMVKDHTEDVSKFRKASQDLKDPDLKSWAGKTLPVLEQHLQQAKDTAQKVGAEKK